VRVVLLMAGNLESCIIIVMVFATPVWGWICTVDPNFTRLVSLSMVGSTVGKFGTGNTVGG